MLSPVLHRHSSDEPNNDLGRGVVLLFLTVVLMVITRNAWLSDDAFITLRTVDNFVHGFGPRYNLAERVQAYTHPLWMALVSLVYFFTREAYYTLIAISLLCSAGAAAIVAFRLAVSRGHAVLALGLLALSKAFADFSTSGLENPLTHLLLALFVTLYARHVGGDRRSLTLLALIAALGALNRMDTALLFFPPLLHATFLSLRWRGPLRHTLLPLGVGMAPLAAWEFFSLLYYGFPFPNTAYAKLGTGIPKPDLIEQGFYYYVDSLSRDPLTLTLIFGGLAMVIVDGVARRQARVLALACGPVFYLAYVLWIGGDFMSGRFFSAVFFLVVALISQTPLPRVSMTTLLAMAVVIHLGFIKDSGSNAPIGIGASGIVDERSYYAGLTALTKSSRDARVLARTSPWKGFDAEKPPSVRFEGAIGLVGYSAGPGTHLVDFLGLTDPLLARLPTQNRFHWRIGHFERKQPIGYLETLRSGKNRIVDPDTAAFHDHLSLVVRGDLFSWQRLRTIVAFNLGRYDALINRDFHGKPHGYEVDQKQISRIKAEGFPWNDASNIRMAPRNGVLVRLGHVSHCRSLELGLTGDTKYSWTFYQGEAPVVYYGTRHRLVVSGAVPMKSGDGLRKRRLEVPPAIATAGFDALLLFPYDAGRNDRFSLGYVLLCDQSTVAVTPDQRPRSR